MSKITTAARAAKEPSLTVKKKGEPSLTVKESSEEAPQQGKRRSSAGGRQQGYHLTPAVEAALTTAAADLPISPEQIVDTAVRDWLRTWRPDLM